MIKRKALKNYKWCATLFITNFFKKSNYFCATGKLTKDEIQKSYVNQHSNKKKLYFRKLVKGKERIW
jgi:hypothetical protein